MRTIAATILGCAFLMAGCAAPQPALLKKVTLVKGDGKEEILSDDKLSAFQRLMRSRLPAPSGNAWDRSGEVRWILAMERDVPEGEGNEGRYAAVVRSGNAAELWYFEQREHLPRTDRFYHRPLGSDELRQLEDVLKRHPVGKLQENNTQAIPATQATQPAAVPAVTEAEGIPAVEVVRLWDADEKASRTVELQMPAVGAGAQEMIGLIEALSNAGGYSCRYVQPIPPSSRVLFADPHRWVEGIWTEGEELRALITVPGAASQWFVHQAGQWETSESPPLAATQPATRSAATAPATAPATTAPASAPATSRFSNPGLLAEQESWWTEPADNFTTVWHYVPLSETNSQTRAFVVPTFVFDDAHAAINVPARMLYILHDGQLIGLPIPPSVMLGR